MSKKPYNIAVIVKALNSDFWQTMLNGAKKAAEEHPELLKVTTYGPPEETDVALQRNFTAGSKRSPGRYRYRLH